MNTKFSRIIFTFLGIVFFSVGIVLVIIGGIVLQKNISFMNIAQKTEAEIISVSADRNRRFGKNYTRYDVWIEYTVNGEVLEKNLNEYNSSMYEGKKIDVYYDPDNPSDVRTYSKTFEFIFLGIGSLFTVIGAVFLIVNVMSRRNIKNLKKSGDKLSGTITNVVRNYNMTINNRHPYKAECEVINPYDGETYLYSSDNVTDDISGLTGMTVTVYVDKNNKKKYYVDIYELMERYSANNNIHDYR